MSPVEMNTLSKKWATALVRRLSLARFMIDELAQEAAIGILAACKNFDPSLSTFEQRAFVHANYRMRRHIKAMAGVVNQPRRRAGTPRSVALIVEDQEGNETSICDDYTDATQLDELAFTEALAATDARTTLMIEAKMKGATYEEIAEGLGVSREFVRKKVIKFAEDLGAS